jgi:hypothetical protein
MPGKQDGPDRDAGVEPDKPEPAPAAEAAGGTLVLPTPVQVPRPALLPAWLLILPATTLAVGLVAGFALGSTRADGPAKASVTRSPATQPTTAPPTSVVVRLTATSACLETAKRADQLIHLLVTNERRGDRVAELLIAYGVASRQCRMDGGP